MTTSAKYYPTTNDGRAHWWGNWQTVEAGAAMDALGVDAGLRGSIENDAKLGVYVYGTARAPFDKFNTEVLQFLALIASGPNGQAIASPPAVPVMPPVPDMPAEAAICGLETRRVLWVPQLKSLPLYTLPLGTALGLESGGTPFNPATYQTELSDLTSPAARVVAGKFRKANGNIDGVNLYGRLAGTVPFTMLKTCMVSPFTANVPLAGAAPEAWEFYARAVKADVEIGIASAMLGALIHG